MSTVLGTLNFQSHAVPASLTTTGSVYLDRDTTGSDTAPVGLDPAPTEVAVHNGRPLSLSLDRNGFVLVPHAYDHIDYLNESDIIRTYYAEACRLVKEATGADKVIAFDHNVRFSNRRSWMNDAADPAEAEQIKGGNLVMSPALVVHNDYTLTSAPLRLRMLSEPAKINDTWKSLVPEGGSLISSEELAQRMGKRYALINVWRNISEEAVEDMPLALCDGSSLNRDDLITFEIRYCDRVGENYFARYSPDQNWVYFPRMVKDEAILLKVWDSAADLSAASADPSAPTCFSLHSAFKDPSATENCPRRQSIEIRTAVFY